jgi:AraC family transcriptional regulator
VRTKGRLDPRALDAQVELEFRDVDTPPDTQRRITWRGLSAETVIVQGAREFDYKWAGSTHYLAVHDIRRDAGETLVDDVPPSTQLDMRDLLTFIPEGCRVSGWSKLRPRTNTFTAIYYDPAILPEELGTRLAGIERPMLCFDHAGLRMTLAKIEALLVNPDPINAIYGVVGLSRFHFSRSFRRTTGLAPYQFILASRVERAKAILSGSETTMAEISAGLGFGSQPQFSAAFRKLTGLTPSQFRRTRG